jgi:hypothetical protein
MMTQVLTIAGYFVFMIVALALAAALTEFVETRRARSAALLAAKAALAEVPNAVWRLAGLAQQVELYGRLGMVQEKDQAWSEFNQELRQVLPGQLAQGLCALRTLRGLKL